MHSKLMVWKVVLLAIFSLLLSPATSSAQVGANFILPLPRRSVITQTFDEHSCNCAPQPLAIIVNATQDSSGDTGMSYSGFNR